MRLQPVVLATCILAGVTDLQADYLKVQRQTPIKLEAQASAAKITTVDAGVCLTLLSSEQLNGYYSVRVPGDGRSGWVYRTMVRRFPGSAPDSSPAPTESRSTEATTSNPLLPPPDLSPSERTYAQRHLSIGKPQAVYERFRQGYAVAYDPRLKIPLWVQYELTKDELDGVVKRGDHGFYGDTSIPAVARSEPDDYEEPVYDQGHMAPANDMLRSQSVLDECFLLSNICPQVGIGFNRHIWEQLESAVHGWVRQRGRLLIITGPVFAPSNGKVTYPVIGKGGVAVPTHFYKIVVDTTKPDHPEAMAFMLPNTVLTGHKYSEYLCTIREIEAVTGLDFLSAFPRETQDRLETTKPDRVW